MSRKDGFSTNAEILADFRCASHKVLTDAYERQLASDKLPAWFEEKPLAALFLTVGTLPVEPALGRVSVLSEMLLIQPLDNRIGIILEAHPAYKKYPDDVKERYQKLGATVASTVLSKELSLASILPMEAINADYIAKMSSGEEVEAGIFEKKQTKPALVAAKWFALDALDYVHSDNFMEQESSRLFHHFGMEISPNLPLNGFEPSQFLIEFRRGMINEYNRWHHIVNAEPEDDESQMIVEAIKAYVQKCARAAEKAQEILDRRNDYE